MKDTKKVEEKELEIQQGLDETNTEKDQSDPSEEQMTDTDYKEKYLRLLSEFTHFQRQKEDEIKAMALYGNKSLLLKMIDLLDDMEFGLHQEGIHEETKSLLELLKSKFENTLNVEGVKEITLMKGDEYDSQTCEVISTLPDEQNKGKIIEIVRKGYMLSDRVLRTAKVIVGK